MCGFVALAGDGATAPGIVETGLAAIRHRGPDGEGTWRAKDGRASMAHARLAIIDLSESGTQPMLSADGGSVIAFNGEIYNYKELAPRVQKALRSTSDTEVLVELMRSRGPEAIRLLRGMFSFAYWDGDELLLVRDRLGIKPLFYAASSTRIAAASELEALVAMGVTQRRIDLRAIDDYLTYLYVPPPRTGIIGCQEVPPGHLIRWRPGRDAVLERYWSVPTQAPHPVSARQTRDAIEDAVRCHLVSDTPVGVFLSGGLDSSSLVALAAPHYAGPLQTFSITFGDEGRYLDERGFARLVASHFGTHHREIRVAANVAQILPELVARFGQPFGNPTAVLTYALSQATRQYVKVALAGDGGDELLGGYPRYQGLWLAGLARRAPAVATEGLAHLLSRVTSTSGPRGARTDRLRRFLAGAHLPLDTMYYRWVSYLDEERKSHLLADRAGMISGEPPTEEFEFLATIRRRHAERAMRDCAGLVDLESFLPNNVLRYGDRMSMAHALEVRVPFCDHLLAEQLAALPLSTKMPAGVQKGLFRWAMRRDLPRQVTLHRKVGFNPPLAAWLRGDLAPVVEEYLSGHAVRDRGLLSVEAVEDLRRTFEGGRSDAAHTIWSIVVLEAWLRWLERQKEGVSWRVAA